MFAGLSLDYSGRMRLCGCLGKARRGQPSPTAVGRYVDSHAARPTKALAAILTKYAKRIAGASVKAYKPPVIEKAFDPEEHSVDLGRVFDAGRDARELTPKEFAAMALRAADPSKLDTKAALSARAAFIASFDAQSVLMRSLWADERGKETVATFLRALNFDSIKLDESGKDTYGLLGRLGKLFDPDQPRDERGRWGEGDDGPATREPVTQTAEFKAWFGSSKVVDPAGKPLVVYHGTRGDIDAFDPAKIGARHPEQSKAFYFSTRTETASLYADSLANAAEGFRPDSKSAKPVQPGANVMPVYVSLQNPLVLETKEFSGERVLDANKGAIVTKAKADGHDGVIIRRNVGDEWDGMTVVAFRPEQIKSAIGNSGRFDPKSPDITKLAKADDDLKMILAALEDEMKDMSAEMRLALATEMLAAFRRAGTVGVMQAGFAMTPEIVKQLGEKARAFAAERGGWLIKNLAGTTIENLRSTLARGVEEGMSADDLSDAIQEAGAFGEFRADMIARTELAFAHVQGNVEGWRITGEVELKRSILGDLHDIDDECDEAVDAGDIPLEDDFIDGYAFPPYHPNCICDVLPILREDQDGGNG